MNQTEPAPQASQAPSAEPSTPGDLARHGIDYARAWSELFTSEAKLARQSAGRLLVAAICVCVLLPGAVIICDALAVSVLNRWLNDWAISLAVTLVLNLLALCALGLAIRAWWGNLSLPRSRRALCELAGRIK